MPKHMKRFFSCTLMLLLVSMSVRAELYLVVGSYSQVASAASEATRLSNSLGVDVITHATEVDGKLYQRVLIRAGSTNSEIDQSLAQQGISPWLYSVDTDASSASMTNVGDPAIEKASVDSDSQQYFVVAASYTDVEQALDEERKLADNFNSVKGQTSLVDGDVQHRVLVGPNKKTIAEANRDELVSLGYESAWLLAAAADEYGYLSSVTSSTPNERVSQEAPQVIESIVPVVEEDTSGFNLATLPKKNPVFTIE